MVEEEIEEPKKLAPPKDDYQNVFWTAERLHIICYVHEEDVQPLVDNYERVAQELYVPEGKAESVFRIFTSSASDHEFLARIPLKPEYIAYLKIVSMNQEQLLDILKGIDKRHQARGSFIRADVLSLDNGFEKREILFSRFIDKN